jgi:hypothetical protein
MRPAKRRVDCASALLQAASLALAYAAVWPQLPLPSPKSSLRVMRDGQRKLRPKL